jgi:HlyD family secretion protein
VYVVEAGEVKPLSIQLGITDNRNTEVVGGDLKPGDKVIVGENSASPGGKPSSVGMRLF